MKSSIILFLVLMLSTSAFGQQNLTVLKPAIGTVPDLSEKRQREFELRDKAIAKLRKGVSADALTPKEKAVIKKLGESDDFSIWDTMDQGCSWYCGGGPYKVTASSALKPSGGITYVAGNAHDFSFKTAWVEGAQGYGIGESLQYYFKNRSPRVTDVLVYNGYVKSEAVWKKNSRVKKLKLWVNGRPYAVLALQDTRALQKFKLGEPLGQTKDGKDLILKFEILDVYKGDSYEDTAITELYFDGLDVHCLARGTMIALEHGERPIEAIVAGDRVKQFDLVNSRMTTARVTRVVHAVHSNLLTLKLDNGREITTTEDHPFRVVGKGWCSYRPDKSQAGIEGRYEIADTFLFYDGAKGVKRAQLREIVKGSSAGDTFTLELDSGSGFIGNGFIVGTEQIAGNGAVLPDGPLRK